MKRGFILGKFMPLHKGHEALIQYGIDNCDQLTVLVCSLPTEPIDGFSRFIWVKNRFPQARVLWCNKILPQEPLSDFDFVFWNTWCKVIQSYHPEEVNVIFGSEDYVETLAEYMMCEAKVFDKARTIVPISGTKCRNNPAKYWDYMNEDVRKHFVRKVLITGTESNGKSTLTENLAKHYDTVFMPEYAREYIDTYLGGDMDKLQLAHFDEFSFRHRMYEGTKQNEANKVMFTDTDAITTLIFSREYFGEVSQQVISLANSEDYDLVLLCHPDVPWIDDGQRNLSEKRWELHEQFKHEMSIRNIKWIDITGDWNERWAKATWAVDNMMYQEKTISLWQ